MIARQVKGITMTLDGKGYAGHRIRTLFQYEFPSRRIEPVRVFILIHPGCVYELQAVALTYRKRFRTAISGAAVLPQQGTIDIYHYVASVPSISVAVMHIEGIRATLT